jgi:uncharacterized paraquat-inducible protein A
MAKIPGWAYAAVGAAITGYSWYVERQTENTTMSFFFWIGVALMGVGVFKVLTGYILNSKKKEQPQKKEQTQRRDERSRPQEARDAIICPRCNAKLHPRSRYCNWCGTRQ